MNGSIRITHSATEADETARAADERPSTEARREAVKRAQERLRAEVPARLSTAVRIDGDGKFTQQYSGAGTASASDCGCNKPGAFAGITSPTTVEMTMNNQPQARQPQNIVDKAATAYAARVNAARAVSATVALAARSAKKAPIVLFDENGVILGLAMDASKITVPDKQNVAAFDDQGRLLGMIATKDITAVAPGEPVGRSSSGVVPPEQVALQPQIPVSPQMASLKRAGF